VTDNALRWGILGTGGIVRRWLPGFQASGDVLAIVGSREAARARAAAREFGAERGGSYEDVLSATDVDVIYNALPNEPHVEWTVRAAEAGKHCLCEKPLAPTVEGCQRMVAAAERHRVHLVEAFMYRYNPRWTRVRELLDGGEIGPVRLARAAFGFYMGPDRASDVRLSPALGGGATQDVGCYAVNAVRWLLGEPSEVRGWALDRRGAGVDTHAAAVLAYPDDVLAEVACSFDASLGQALEVVGERGRIEVPSPFLPRGQTTVRLTVGADERVETFREVNQYELEVRAVRALLRDGTPTLTPGSDGIANQRVLTAWRDR
jgi:D-xylose 1-dehydrogenase (NADP+, D-xylono-1,5-lactone-forming)